MQSLLMSSILLRHADWVLWIKQNRTRLGAKWMLEKILKNEQLHCDYYWPAPCVCYARSAFPSRRCPWAGGLMASGMCSFLLLISIPGPCLLYSSPPASAGSGAAPPPSPQWSWRSCGPASWPGALLPGAGPWSWPPHCPWSASHVCLVLHWH